MRAINIAVRVAVYGVVVALFAALADLVFVDLSSSAFLICALVVLSLNVALVFFGRDIFRPKTPGSLYAWLVTLPIGFTLLEVALLALAALGLITALITLLLQCIALLACVAIMFTFARNLALIGQHRMQTERTRIQTGVQRIAGNEILSAANGNPALASNAEFQKKIAQLKTAIDYQAPSGHAQVQALMREIDDRLGALKQSILSCADERDVLAVSADADELMYKLKQKDDMAKLYH